MSDREETDLLLDLGLSPPSVLCFLLFVIPVGTICVFSVHGSSVVHGSSSCLVFIVEFRPNVRSHLAVSFLHLQLLPLSRRDFPTEQ